MTAADIAALLAAEFGDRRHRQDARADAIDPFVAVEPARPGRGVHASSATTRG